MMSTIKLLLQEENVLVLHRAVFAGIANAFRVVCAPVEMLQQTAEGSISLQTIQ
jgi:hypothetical protein